jgi:hypothetical protein
MKCFSDIFKVSLDGQNVVEPMEVMVKKKMGWKVRSFYARASETQFIGIPALTNLRIWVKKAVGSSEPKEISHDVCLC